MVFLPYSLSKVGKPPKGIEVKLEASTGEICYRGRNIFLGYLKMEDKTKEAIDEDGWLHSGEIFSIIVFSLFIVPFHCCFKKKKGAKSHNIMK